ncbi:Autophagy-related protein 13 [Trichoplax sp. H2]|nr:Autophagy-related protein 13 [Trichoplax sp. H2]|eukprot:RDD45002.1 Autophagy-related protein 13 [Trichoplax sp. H2]
MASIPVRDGPQINSDLDLFLKFFVQKATQVIAQSRTGQKYRTKSKPTPRSTDWFTLDLEDNRVIIDEIRTLYSSKSFREDEPLCMEISLTSPEGNCMVLEIWSFTLNTTKFDPNVRVRYTVYNRFGMLLRSLFAVSRAVPAYNLARKHGHEIRILIILSHTSLSYFLSSSLYYGEPQLSNLGEGYKTLQVGSVGTPGGYLIVSLAYRSKYILDDRSSQDTIGRPQSVRPKLIKSINDGQVLDVTMTSNLKDRITDELASAMADDFSSKSSTTAAVPIVNKDKIPNTVSESPVCHSLPKTTVLAAFVEGSSPQNMTPPRRPSMPVIFSSPVPFQSLLQGRNVTAPFLDKEGIDDSAVTGSYEGTLGIESRRESFMEEDDFVMVDLNPAFATTPSLESDLAAFYRACQSAPRLRMFDNDTALDLTAQGLDTIGQELDNFKKLGEEFESSLGPYVKFE